MAFAPRGIKNVGEFYSQHFLDEILETRLKGTVQQWSEGDRAEGLRELKRQFSELHQRVLNQQLGTASAGEIPALTHRLHLHTLATLGYAGLTQEGASLDLQDSVVAPALVDVEDERGRHFVAIETHFIGANEAILDAPITTATPDSPTDGDVAFDGDVEDLIDAVFKMDRPPRWLLAMGGRVLLLAERSRWAQGGYLLFHLDEALGDPIETRIAAGLLARDATCPAEGTAFHDQLEEESHRHAFGVSKDLKYNVREAVELLGNAWIAHQRKSKKKLFADDAPESLMSDKLAGELTNECLTFLYRLLFVFYAEARGEELEILPMNGDAYRLGYSLEHLRDLELVPLHAAQAKSGTFLHESIERLFGLIHRGVRHDQADLLKVAETFEIPELSSALFDPARTPRLSSARFPNETMQQVLRLLSLSRERERGRGKRKNRGRISYARLGINQLGAVYEGLLSYTGFFAQETLYELKVADAKDDSDVLEQVFFARESEVQKFKENEFVLVPDPNDPDGPRQRKRYPKGAFVYRLAGRDRVRSASYYTPEVLTRCVVKYSLKELLPGKTADEILNLKICEPAMGSGAFLNEAINQLADAYLDRKQAELGKRIPQGELSIERQRVKAYIATHNAYGVDLNPVAVDLAKVSLWLNILGPGIPVPWFDLRLAVGNSLFGCRRQIFRAADVLRKDTKDHRNYLGMVPEAVPLGEPLPDEAVFHFLLPDEGMGAIADDKVAAELAPNEIAALKEWRREFIDAPWTEKEVDRLKAITKAADVLWQRHLDARVEALRNTAQAIPVWGQAVSENGPSLSRPDREAEVRKRLGHETHPGNRLKLVMDAWCSVWMRPLESEEHCPTRAQRVNACDELLDGKLASLEGLSKEHPWLTEAQLGFMHWELQFPEAFRGRGGFDLVVGNPPWIKLDWTEAGILSDFDATIGVRETSASDLAKRRGDLLDGREKRLRYLSEMNQTLGLKAHLGALAAYPVLEGVQANLYKNFLVTAWRSATSEGAIGLLHQPTMFDDPRGGKLRREAYKRLRLAAIFTNELKLFADVNNGRPYCFTISKGSIGPSFDAVANLFHPKTIDDCYQSAGIGEVPAIKTAESEWELRGHRNRIVKVDETNLGAFAKLYDEPGTSPVEARLPVIHSTDMLRVLRRFADAPKLRDFAGEWDATVMWDETNRQKDGTIRAQERDCKSPDEWIVSGPHFYVGTPFNKTPNPGRKSNVDYSPIDLVDLREDYLPRTLYVPGCSKAEYRNRAPRFRDVTFTESFRHVHRRRLAVTGERTLISAIIPPGAGHIDQVTSVCFVDEMKLLSTEAFSCSLPADFLVRSTGKGDLRGNDFGLLPAVTMPGGAILRILRLNCLTEHYRDLWERNWAPAFVQEKWTKTDHRLPSVSLTGRWKRDCALRTGFERREALVELDALAAIALGITIDELCLIYRVQFPVLQQYERDNRYDQRGRLVSSKALALIANTGQTEGEVEDPANPRMKYLLPFDACDREADMRQAYAEFERRFANHKRGAA